MIEDAEHFSLPAGRLLLTQILTLMSLGREHEDNQGTAINPSW